MLLTTQRYKKEIAMMLSKYVSNNLSTISKIKIWNNLFQGKVSNSLVN